MNKKNGSGAGLSDQGDNDFDLDASEQLEIYWQLIAASRQRQDKPALLTAQEQLLTLEGCELLVKREHEAEAAFDKARADKERIKWLGWILPLELFIFAAGASLWLLAEMEWLPEDF